MFHIVDPYFLKLTLYLDKNLKGKTKMREIGGERERGKERTRMIKNILFLLIFFPLL